MSDSKIPALNKLSGDANLDKKKIVVASLVPKPEIVIGMSVIRVISGI